MWSTPSTHLLPPGFLLTLLSVCGHLGEELFHCPGNKGSVLIASELQLCCQGSDFFVPGFHPLVVILGKGGARQEGRCGEMREGCGKKKEGIW